MRKTFYRNISILKSHLCARIPKALRCHVVWGVVALFVVVSFVVGIYLWAGMSKPRTKADRSLGITHAVSDKTQRSPLKLRIAKLKIDTFIEPVGIDTQGNMAAPRDPQGVSWYAEGGFPGIPGNVVLAGHVDDVQGNPAVFARLTTLTKGDTITITTMSGKVYLYTVNSRATYPYDKAPLEDIFGKSEKERLVLITCSGKWDEKTKNYADREVIYATR